MKGRREEVLKKHVKPRKAQKDDLEGSVTANEYSLGILRRDLAVTTVMITLAGGDNPRSLRWTA